MVQERKRGGRGKGGGEGGREGGGREGGREEGGRSREQERERVEKVYHIVFILER